MKLHRHFVHRLLCVFYIASSTFCVSLKNSRHLEWRRYKSYDDSLPLDPDMSSYLQAKDDRACARLCQSVYWCNAFFFNADTRDCSLQRLVETENMTSAPGWRYFRLESVCPAGMNYIPDRVTSTCYRLDLSLKQRDEAHDACKANNDQQVVLEPIEKAQFVKDFLSANKGLTSTDIIIGAVRPNSGVEFPASGPDFNWENREPVNMNTTMAFWVTGKPEYTASHGIIMLRRDVDFDWSEGPLFTPMQFMCERPFNNEVEQAVVNDSFITKDIYIGAKAVETTSDNAFEWLNGKPVANDTCEWKKNGPGQNNSAWVMTLKKNPHFECAVANGKPKRHFICEMPFFH